MKVSKIADGAYFVPSYSVQTITTNFNRLAAQVVAHAAKEDEDADDDKESAELEYSQ